MANEVELREFKRKVKKVNSSRVHKVKNSLGIRQAFLYAQSHKWFDIGQSLKEQQFQQIIREINDQLAFELMEGRPIVFPEKMGCLEVRKTERYVKKDGDKFKTNYRIDWDKTLELWCEDKEAFSNKTLVRDINETERFIILYNRADADYQNKCYMQFRPVRSIKKILGQNVKQGKIESFGHGWLH